MKKLLVVSDNHGDTRRLNKIFDIVEYDISIHLGDAELSESYMDEHFDYFVAGNHDSFKDIELVFNVEDVKIAIGHGHKFGFSFFGSKNTFVEFGKKHQADLVLHGHTHVPKDINDAGIRIVCPGSTDHSRSGPNSFAIITIDKKDVEVSFVEIDKI